MYDFKITNTDTDSISFCKEDYSEFNKIEISKLINEINDISPEFITWEDDGYYPVFIVLKSKNYVMVDEKGKRKIKGSALKSSTLEPILKQMLNQFVDALINDEQHKLLDIYHSYVKQALNITDIKQWAKKLQLSPTTFKSERENERKIVRAIEGSEYKSGDRIYVYTTDERELKLAEKFDGKYDIDTYLEKLFKTTQRFSTILDTKAMFLNYALKRNKTKLSDVSQQ